MDEKGELKNREQVVVPPELSERMDEAKQVIEAERQLPEAEIASTAGQMSMMAELGKLAKDTGKHKLGILFKDVKAVLGVLPYANKISEVITPVGKGSAVVKIDKYLAAENEAARAAKSSGRLEAKVAKARTKEPGFPATKGQEKLNRKATAAAERLAEARKHEALTYDHAKEAITDLTNSNGPDQGRISRLVHRVTGVQTEHEYRRRFLDHDAWAKEQLAAGKLGSAMSDKELLRAAANGEAPARNFREKVGRGAKIAGKHMILESLGPIINPIPDVPGVVALASYGAEVFGQQWWAGLIPPVWQYMHNRYEDMQTSMSAGRKAREIIMRHWNQRIDRLEEKRIEKAAGVFLPRKDLPLAV